MQFANENLAELENTVGHVFNDIGLLTRAVTHSSFCRSASGQAGEQSNEQMEFLGDSILGFIVSDALVSLFPDESEGQLSKRKARIVSASHLYHAARRLNLGHHLRLGKGEEKSGGRTKPGLLADAFEALVASIYLDGGLEPARRLVQNCLLESIPSPISADSDCKTALQEFLQGRRLPPPKYVVVEEKGPEHDKIFTVQVFIGETRLAQAEGPTKKTAQQAAARIALSDLRSRQIEAK
ncbi:MAG: ribonuclease III [Acidobacteria bacterium RIFCSPLOWO2_12_FULL_54_10]|nr:MAG: ribonuclease III [Acidobacteria bacterium RIFCSPLOWO2_12_FULL_54_10]